MAWNAVWVEPICNWGSAGCTHKVRGMTAIAGGEDRRRSSHFDVATRVDALASAGMTDAGVALLQFSG
jgi:hypothetical protein